MLSGSTVLRSAAKLLPRPNHSSGRVWCSNISVQPGGLKPKTVPPRYLGQLSPFTHPHLIKHGEVTPGLSQTEYELRRHRLASLIEAQADRLGPSASSSTHVVIVLSHPTRYMTNDIPYPFHQNQDFLYLSGILEPDSALVLYGKGRPDEAILFVPCRDPGRELWDGPRSGKDGAAALTGIERVHSIEELGVVLKSLKGTMLWYDSAQPAHPRLHQTNMCALLGAGPVPHSLRPLIHHLRALKSSAEVALMQEAGRITAQAFRRTMALSHGDVDEAVLFAKFDFENRIRGANFLAYPPVVAGGNRANTLHYINNNQIVKDGEMVLFDGGCEYFGYVSDITRTWPVNGKFSPAQAELYEAVLEVQHSCLSLCFPGVSLDHIYTTMLALLGRQLGRLGIMKDGTSDADLSITVLHKCWLVVSTRRVVAFLKRERNRWDVWSGERHCKYSQRSRNCCMRNQPPGVYTAIPLACVFGSHLARRFPHRDSPPEHFRPEIQDFSADYGGQDRVQHGGRVLGQFLCRRRGHMRLSEGRTFACSATPPSHLLFRSAKEQNLQEGRGTGICREE